MDIKTKEFVNVTAFEYKDMRAWCVENFGKDGYMKCDGNFELDRWDSWSQCDGLASAQLMKWRGRALFDFKNDDDYFLFSLRWS